MKRRGFALIELLVSIAIIGMMVALLVPVIDRNLERGQLTGDVEIVRSKIEFTRLLSGSTQRIDERESGFVPFQDNIEDQVGYYAVFFPVNQPNFYILRLTSDLNDNDNICSAKNAVRVDPPADCLVEQVRFSRGVSATVNAPWAETGLVIAYRPPFQQLSLLKNIRGEWQERLPVFSADPRPLTLRFGGETAELTFLDFSARVEASYTR